MAGGYDTFYWLWLGRAGGPVAPPSVSEPSSFYYLIFQRSTITGAIAFERSVKSEPLFATGLAYNGVSFRTSIASNPEFQPSIQYSRVEFHAR